MNKLLCAGISTVLAASSIFSAEEVPRLLLPDTLYAVPGIEMNVYFSNIFLAVNPSNYVYDVECSKGRNDEKRWRFIPTEEDVGTHDWKITVYDDDGAVASGTAKLIVTTKNAGDGRSASILMIGDSLTDQSFYAERLHQLCPELKMIGSHAGGGKTTGPDGIAHEGYGGWSWGSFVALVEPKAPDVLPYRTNKFLARKNGEWRLDFQQYFDKYNDGKTPDFITIQLGVNDVFAATDADIQEKINSILKSMDKLIDAIRKDASDAVIGIGLTTAGANQDAFGAGYKCGQTAWQFRKNQQAACATYIKKVATLKDPKIVIIPTCLNLDRENNFPVALEKVTACSAADVSRQNNGVHPAKAGGDQMGDTFFCWLKYHLLKYNV